ncbi:hypothetical protein HK405_007543 [Cladochytrium tenue]|nr:hypothetical protein HK405_007543 [Cladochytrium tenue]
MPPNPFDLVFTYFFRRKEAKFQFIREAAADLVDLIKASDPSLLVSTIPEQGAVHVAYRICVFLEPGDPQRAKWDRPGVLPYVKNEQGLPYAPEYKLDHISTKPDKKQEQLQKMAEKAKQDLQKPGDFIFILLPV